MSSISSKHLKSSGFRRERIISAAVLLCFPASEKFDHGVLPTCGYCDALHRAPFQDQPDRLLLFLLLTGRMVQGDLKICSRTRCSQPSSSEVQRRPLLAPTSSVETGTKIPIGVCHKYCIQLSQFLSQAYLLREESAH